MRADSTLEPITPSGKIDKDIAAVMQLLKGYTCMGLPNTCLDPDTVWNRRSRGAPDHVQWPSK